MTKRRPYRKDLIRELGNVKSKQGRKAGSAKGKRASDAGEFEVGRVLANFGIRCLVRFDDGKERRLPISRRLSAVAGDLVNADEKRVLEILPRERVLARADQERTQILAANIDRILLVQSASNPPYRSGLTDRYHVFAAVMGLPLILLMNKTDEAHPGVLEKADEYRDHGVEVLPVCAKSGVGQEKLIELISEGISVFSGHSGVGKSSLLSLLLPGQTIGIGELHAATGQGRQKTTTARAYPFRNGYLIDTPGIRQFSFVGIDPQVVSHAFQEIDEIAPQCRYRNCLHISEPECAVLRAVAKRKISQKRYQSYLRIIQSLETE